MKEVTEEVKETGVLQGAELEVRAEEVEIAGEPEKIEEKELKEETQEAKVKAKKVTEADVTVQMTVETVKIAKREVKMEGDSRIEIV